MPAPSPAAVLVACLCAEWCGVCRDYRPVFEALARQDTAARYAWVDIDDDEDALGGLEVDDFPTLLVAQGDTVRFFGVVAPSAAATARALQHALGDDAPAPAVLGAQRHLPARLRALVDRG